MSWERVDLTQYINGDVVKNPPTKLSRDDGQCLLYNGKTHAFNAESESAKTWIALFAAESEMDQKRHVLFIDFEDEPGSVVERLRMLGISSQTISTYFHYMRPDDPLEGEWVTALRQLVEEFHYSLIIIDGVSEAMGLHDLNPDLNKDIVKFYHRLPKFVLRPYTAVVSLDHVVKKKENRNGHAIGGQHKKAGIDVTYELEVMEPFGRGLMGSSKIKVTKDRAGWVRQHCIEKLAGTFYLQSDKDGTVVDIGIRSPNPNDTKEQRPTYLMKECFKWCTNNPGCSGQSFEDNITGKSLAVRKARDLLVKERYINVDRVGSKKSYTVIQAYQGG